MTTVLTVLFVAFAIEAIAIAILKRGLDVIGARYTARRATMSWWRNSLALVGDWFTQRNVITGVFRKAVFFVLLQYLIGQRDISFIWPLTAISFVMTTLTAQFLLREHVAAVRWGGVALIVAGAALISFSENNVPKPHEVASVASASTRTP
jgi:multidrug transporter EmrE-like cation transporter